MIGQCISCCGRKKIIGLGNMTQDCPHCKGIGHIEIKKDEMKVTLRDTMDIPFKSKRGRKKKLENVLKC